MKSVINRNLGIILLVLLGVFACENNKEEITTGLEGLVYRGPINPLVIEGQVNDAPFIPIKHSNVV